MIDTRVNAFEPKHSKGVAYREAGKGPAIVLLHGIGSSSAAWLFQLEALQGFRLIAWDAPGYGDSQALPGENPQAGHYAEALRAFIERLILKDVLLVGNSLGCLMAGAYARIEPEKLRGMILISPASGNAGDRTSFLERKKVLEELGPEGMAEKRSPKLLGSRGTPEALELIRWSQRRIAPAGYLQAASCLADGNLAADARHFRKPVLVVCGTDDQITPEAGCKLVAGAFPNAEYRSLPGLGHCAQVEDPTGTNAMITGFKC